MSILLKSAAIVLGIGVCTCLPLSARAQELTTENSEQLCLLSSPEDTEQEKTPSLSFRSVRGGKKPGANRNLGSLLRNIGREWPRLLNSYVQPAVRGLLADQQGGNTLALRTTLFRNNKRGLQLDGGIGRNFSGEREARIQLSARF